MRKLSKERFYTDIEFDLGEVYIHKNYVADRSLVIDTAVAGYRAYDKKGLDVISGQKTIENIVCEQNLENVLNKGVEVEIGNVTYRDTRLVMSKDKKVKLLIGEKYARQIGQWLYCFYLNDMFYFFEFCPADEDMGIEEDSYMFVCALMRCTPNGLDLDKMLKLEEYAEKLQIQGIRRSK